MGCCGKNIKKVGSIATGYAKKLFGIEDARAYERQKICFGCDMLTYFSKTEYILWLARHGLTIAANFTQLEKLPLLPKQEGTESRTLPLCRSCKCHVGAKTLIADEDCPLGKWPKVERPAEKPLPVQT